MDTVRAVTLNLWGEQPPLAERLAVVERGLRALAPDVIALQEVRQVPEQVPNTAETLAARLGLSCAFAVSTPWGGGDEGLAILSPHPIVHQEHRELPHATASERRIVLGAVVATPAGELHALCTHLTYRLGDGIKREAQVEAVDAFAAALAAARPTELPRILMGDFNATPDHDEIRFLRGLHTLAGRRAVWQDAWARLHPDEHGWTWALRNPYTEKLAFLDQDRRLDYVFVSPRMRDGRGAIEACRIVFDEPEEGVFASDHFGLLAEVRVRPVGAK